MNQETQLNRRNMLKAGLALAAVHALPFSRALAAYGASSRSLYFYHIHTGEKGRFTYWEDGKYVPEAMLEISWLLRDFRAGLMKPVDKHLLDQLAVLQHLTGSDRGFEVISGYRSAATNQKLLETTDGVDENSLHMQGRAIDVRPYGVALERLHGAAISLHAGGVGFYPDSQFVHLDTGAVQQWVWK